MKKLLLLLACCATFLSSPSMADDWRAYHHGIDYVPAADGRMWVFFSSVADPSRTIGDEEDWTHDIYVAEWEAGQKKLTPRPFIVYKGAQEPVSAAAAQDGRIMVIAEDGNHSDEEVDERYGVFNRDLTPVISYPEQVESGGHSGHVAAVGNRFVVFYSDGWVKGGGVDNLGSGRGVYVKIYNADGDEERDIDIAADKREWWPLIAAAPDKALLVWQSFVPGHTYARLKASLLDPATGQLTPVEIPEFDLTYYTYNVRYIPAAAAFLVVATQQDGKGQAFLIDTKGQITAHLPCMPPIVREAGIGVLGNRAVIPSGDDDLIVLQTTTATALTLVGTLTAPFSWAEEGSIGIPYANTKLHWVSLDRYGLQETELDLKNMKKPTARDLCR